MSNKLAFLTLMSLYSSSALCMLIPITRGLKSVSSSRMIATTSKNDSCEQKTCTCRIPYGQQSRDTGTVLYDEIRRYKRNIKKLDSCKILDSSDLNAVRDALCSDALSCAKAAESGVHRTALYTMLVFGGVTLPSFFCIFYGIDFPGLAEIAAGAVSMTAGASVVGYLTPETDEEKAMKSYLMDKSTEIEKVFDAINNKKPRASKE